MQSRRAAGRNSALPSHAIRLVARLVRAARHQPARPPRLQLAIEFEKSTVSNRRSTWSRMQGVRASSCHGPGALLRVNPGPAARQAKTQTEGCLSGLIVGDVVQNNVYYCAAGPLDFGVFLKKLCARGGLTFGTLRFLFAPQTATHTITH